MLTKDFDPFGLSAEEFFQKFRGESLTFDDLNILQTKTIDFGVDDVDISTNITRNIKIKTPLVASPMEDVSEYEMAIATALQGFPTIIHYNMSIAEQAEQVDKVKRFENGFITDALFFSPDDTIKSVINKKQETGISTFPVLDGKKLVGLITKNDFSSSLHSDLLVRDRMLPVDRLENRMLSLSSLPTDDTKRLQRANEILLDGHQGVLLIVDEKRMFHSLVTRTDIEKNEAHPDSIKDLYKRLVVGAAVKTNIGETKERATELIKAGVDFLCIDSSHGNSTHERDILKYLKENHPEIDVIYGNVASAAGAIRGVEWGADAIRVGKGVGSICSTSRVSLGTRPQMTATYACARAVNEYRIKNNIDYKIPIISDGGYSSFSAIGKGLLFADVIMLGSMLAGTDESPGRTIYDRQGRKLKEYKGMGSIEAMTHGSASRYDEERSGSMVGEGVVGTIKAKGSISQWVPKIKKGIRKCLQSVGSNSINMLHEDVETGKVLIERMSEAGKREAGIHDLLEYKTELPIRY